MPHHSSRVLLLSLLVFLANLPTARAEEDPSPELAVMTYNLRYASSQPPNAWSARRPVAQELILREQPDVFGTQEALYQQVKDLATDLPDYSWIGTGRDGGSRGEFMAVFYRRDRLEPLEYDHYWLSDTPEVIGSTTWGNTNRRMVTSVKFRDLRTKQDFFFINTHFDHQIQEAREKSAALVLARIAQLNTQLPILLVGDFNAVAESNKVYDALVGEGGFTDTWKTAAKRGESFDTFHNYRTPGKGGRRIDWILARGPVQVRQSEVVTYQKDGQYPSDHFPVIARLTLGAK
jgi:endonuclease/exonuclease/phosphatase family metal-dependent hydrolase